MDASHCNAPTKSKGCCGFSVERCPHEAHKAWRARRVLEDHQDERAPAAAAMASGELTSAFEKHDLRTVSWYWLENLTREFDAKNGAQAASWARLIHSLGEDPEDQASVLAQAALFGGIMHGMPPRDEAQWELARELLDPYTLELVQSWQPGRDRPLPTDEDLPC